MRIAIPREPDSEPRVAATPETVKKMKSLGADVAVEAGAGTRSGVLDSDYEDAGASLHGGAADAVRDADVVLKVRRPSAEEVAQYKRGAIVIAMMDPYGNEAALAARIKRLIGNSPCSDRSPVMDQPSHVGRYTTARPRW